MPPAPYLNNRILSILFRSRVSVLTNLILVIYLNVIIRLPEGIESMSGMIITSAAAVILVAYIVWIAKVLIIPDTTIRYLPEKILRFLNFVSGLLFGYWCMTCLFLL